jgi:hypothetical protein
VEKRVLTVLRSGGEYTPAHVRAMQRQVAQWAPGALFRCLSDVAIPGVETIPLRHKWPGWWAKLELFRPDIGGGYLFTDLDNVILGPIDDMFRVTYTTQRHGWNALMYVPRYFSVGQKAYETFAYDPDHWSEKFKSAPYAVPFGDAGFVNQYVRGDAWEDVVPGQVVNIVELIPKQPLLDRTNVNPRCWPYRLPPENTRVVLCANKNRRPWKLKMFQDLYQEKS